LFLLNRIGIIEAIIYLYISYQEKDRRHSNYQG